MEGVLRSEEMAEIEQLYRSAFDLTSSPVYFPVRHHSPACSLHLSHVIQEYRPDCILIEGPVEANELIDMLAAEETAAPVAIYYSYQDSEGYISEEKRDYKCYYPFLDYSPELTALREAKKAGIRAAFIDLPYHEILIHSREGSGLLAGQEKQTYNDDHLLSQNGYLQAVCEQQGMRNFDELWEKLFEINGRGLSAGEFVKNMLAYCYLSRMNSNAEELAEEGCLVREQFMSGQIEKEQQSGKKILVVTGGFHTYGLLQYAARTKQEKLKLHGKPQKCYLMAYSMEAADRLNGYASGMPFPAFYQAVWEAMEDGLARPYEESLLKNILEIGKKVRKKEGCLSTYDEICAYEMGSSLSALRGKSEPGAYELYDSVLSCFVKGDYNLSTESPVLFFRELMTGKKIGQLCREAEVPPLITDFEKQCREYRFKTRTTTYQEVTLDVFASEKHQRASRFLSRLRFLETTFCEKLKGPSLRYKKDRNLIREIWKYKWNTGVASDLMDKSVYGATVEEAAGSYLKEKLTVTGTDAAEGARLLMQAFEMGLPEIFLQVMDRLKHIMAEDGSFFSLVDCLDYLKTAYELRELYRMEVAPELTDLMSACFEKIIILLPSMSAIREEDCDAAMKACRLLYQLAAGRNSAPGSPRPEEMSSYRSTRLAEAFATLLDKQDLNPKLEGTVLGLCYGMDSGVLPQIMQSIQGYMRGTHEKLLSTAGFLRGLFYGAKDIVFVDSTFIRHTDFLLKQVSESEFMQIVPELRLAFSYFTPSETDRIAKMAAGLYGRKKEDFTKRRGILPQVFQLGRELDRYAAPKTE